MKIKKQWFLYAFIILLIPSKLYSIEFIWEDEKGIKHYKCDSFGTGGEARVKQIGKDSYLVFGGNYSGEVLMVKTPEEAAKKACGE
ncbi:MAG: hypothetical protein OEY59_04360 [Deltaproteobacteria bacterium]|nr:hypothetical protein [Deltaproteobacteria bacterium]